ncbi:MAG: membrane integrity-associated transporter subunit PqiC [Nitrospirae bacterium]|nr:membrane integrity-associated transporter subunit PqiC [Nitrospirota bacterium]MDE3041803.1 membrane integrity-associated transporter subunit PqiC [Nitrospirota bacterium]
MRTMQVRLYRLIGFGIASLVLAGCLSLSREERPIHTFILGLGSSAGGATATAGKPGAGTLLVNVPVAQPGFDTPRMAYTQRPYEVSYYATHQWADPPARMLPPLLVQALEQTGSWRAVVPMPTSVRGDHRVDIDQLELLQTFLQKPSQVRVALRIQIIKLPEYLVLGTRLFEVVEEASNDDAYGGAVAANRAVDRLLKDAAGWLSGCVSGGQGTGCSR